MSNYISTILNIDSTDRILYPKHVYELTNNFENKSILFTKDSNNLLFTLNDHKFSVNDNIVVNNVKGKEFNLSEMYIARRTYPMKADNYVRMHGRANMSEGGGFPDVVNVAELKAITIQLVPPSFE